MTYLFKTIWFNFIKYKYKLISLLIILSISTYLYKSNTSITSNTISDKISKKYIIYKCVHGKSCGGWGDRLKGIISTYAWSLITNREFLINFTNPCQLDKMIEPNCIKWNMSIPDLKNKSSIELKLVDNQNFKNSIKKIDLHSYLSNIDVINVYNNLDWTVHMSKNLFIENKIKSMGYDPNKFKIQYLFFDWYKKLFNLNTELKKKFEDLKKKVKPTVNTELICAQIRTGGVRANHKNDLLFNKYEETKMFWSFINETFVKNYKKYKLFVSTDSELVEKDAISIFGKENVILNEGLITHVDRELEKLNNCTKMHRTILDFHSLQLCDSAVISESGFGKLGLWNRKNPGQNLYLYSVKDALTNNKKLFSGKYTKEFFKTDDLEKFYLY